MARFSWSTWSSHKHALGTYYVLSAVLSKALRIQWQPWQPLSLALTELTNHYPDNYVTVVNAKHDFSVQRPRVHGPQSGTGLVISLSARSLWAHSLLCTLAVVLCSTSLIFVFHLFASIFVSLSLSVSPTKTLSFLRSGEKNAYFSQDPPCLINRRCWLSLFE